MRKRRKRKSKFVKSDVKLLLMLIAVYAIPVYVFLNYIITGSATFDWLEGIFELEIKMGLLLFLMMIPKAFCVGDWLMEYKER